MRFYGIAVSALAVAAFGQPVLPGPGMEPTGAPEALKAALALTDAQVTSLTDLQEQKRQESQTLIEQIADKQTAIREALSQDSPDANAIAALLVQQVSLRKQMQQISTAYNTQALAILTAEQKTKLKDLENAQALRLAVQQAEGLDLLKRPDPPAGLGPAGLGPMRSGGPSPVGRRMRIPFRQ